MSTILEALKKSEQERKRNDLPTLSDMPPPQENTRWPLYVIAVLSLILALVLGVLLSQWLGEPKTPEASPAASTASVEAQPVVSATNLDDVVVNVISYSDVAKQRFVMLNGKMYRENDFVRAGLKVQEIKPDVVVLNHRGELLSRTP